MRDALTTLGMKPYVKTTGSRGLHVRRVETRPLQDVVHTFAKALATELASRNPKLMTVGYRVAARPKGRVVVDYKQNAWGRRWRASIPCAQPGAHRCRRPSHGRNWRRACASKTSQDR